MVPATPILTAMMAAAARQALPGIALVTGMCVLGASAWGIRQWLLSSPRFQVEEVKVEGNTHVTQERLVSQLPSVLGTNLFKLSLAEIEDAAAHSPWVAGVEASRRLPSTLVLKVAERQPAGLLVAGGTYLVDADGQPFKQVRTDRGEGEGLVSITGLDRRHFVVPADQHHFGVTPDRGTPLVKAALSVVASWRGNASRPALSEVHLDRSGITLYVLEGGTAIRLGRAPQEQAAERFERFDAIWAALSPEERASLQTIHLDTPTRQDRVTVRLADAR